MKQHGFSLVELSIVLVILGLLAGGILAGQSLIRAAELRSVGTEYNRWITAMTAFNDQYGAIAGDMPNATRYWGDQAAGTAACADAGVADGTPGTCNGNGDGNWGGGAGATAESIRAWQHLSLAGLIEGNYLGYLAGGTNMMVGSVVPRSKLSNIAGWELLARTTPSNAIYGYQGDIMLLGSQYDFLLGNLWNHVLKPAEIWNIDTKIDDGKPGMGTMLGGGDDVTCVTPNSVDYDAAAAANTNADYNRANNNVSCRAWFKMNQQY